MVRVARMIKIKPQRFGKVAVLMGGMNAEREISLLSGQATLQALQHRGINAFVIDVQKDVIEQLQKTKPDRAFIALHGSFGEDGHIQAILAALDIPYTGSGVAASALAMDKPRTNALLAYFNIPTPPFMLVDQNSDADEICAKLSLPLCVKPAQNGSSCGVTKITEKNQFKPAVVAALQHDKAVMAEKWIEGREYTVGIVGETVLPVLEIIPQEGFYDYKAKYEVDTTQYICPCDLSEQKQLEIQKLAKKAYDVVGASHWGRVDVILDEDERPWFLEVNTIPGLTSHSLVPKAAQVIGIDFDDLIVKILAETLTE